MKLVKPYPQHWFDISLGTSDAHITLTASNQLSLISCEIYIPNSKELFIHLENLKENIQQELGFELEWAELPNKKASRIKALKQVNFSDINQWENYFFLATRKNRNSSTSFSNIY